MQTERYQENPFGGLKWDRLSAWDYPFFMPALLPRTLELQPETNVLLMAAEAALGKLSGGAIRASDFDLLSSAVAILESLSSSKIEGTRSTLDEVLSNEVVPSDIRDQDLREVFNYLAAAEHGQELLATLPISQRLFLQVQQILLSGVRGEEKTPGELRRSPVWVGSGVGPAQAEFIPPLPHLIPELLADWERFVNEGDQGGVLWLALSHYQFETIHPLLDGNGRVGRILIELMLVNRGILPKVALGLSRYFDKYKPEYYQKLQGVRERGEIDAWVQFFAKAVIEQAGFSYQLLVSLVALKKRYVTLVGEELAVALIRNPRVSVNQLKVALGVSQPTAASYLRKAEKLGIAESLGKSGKGNKERWVITEVWNLIQAH